MNLYLLSNRINTNPQAFCNVSSHFDALWSGKNWTFAICTFAKTTSHLWMLECANSSALFQRIQVNFDDSMHGNILYISMPEMNDCCLFSFISWVWFVRVWNLSHFSDHNFVRLFFACIRFQYRFMMHAYNERTESFRCYFMRKLKRRTSSSMSSSQQPSWFIRRFKKRGVCCTTNTSVDIFLKANMHAFTTHTLTHNCLCYSFSLVCISISLEL